MARADVALLATLAVAAACAAPGYSPFPLDLEHRLPADAFDRCRDVLLRRFVTLTRTDRQGFLIQTAWAPSQDPPGERRASVFLDPAVSDSLAVVVELRRLRVPLIGMPSWTEPRGDAAAERALAEVLRAALAEPADVDVTP